jgi:Uma2 family endonuclease
MGAAIKILPHYTYADYCHWQGRWELIEGIPHSMSPAPSPRHQFVASTLNYLLVDALKKQVYCRHCHVYHFLDVLVDQDTVLQPDLLVVCGRLEKVYVDTPPALVAEILSPSTALKDRHVKYGLYEQMGVCWYLLVDADRETVEVFHLENGAYQPVPHQPDAPFELALPGGCSITLHFANIWQ